MKRAAIVLATAGAVGLGTIAAPAPAEARFFGFGPALAGGLIAGAVVGGLASSAYAYGGYPYDGYYGGYAPAYYGGYAPVYEEGYAPAYSYGYDAPYVWGDTGVTTTTTTYYTDDAPDYYSYGSVGGPLYLSTRMPHAGVHHRLHRR
jgi:hypothetical protein